MEQLNIQAMIHREMQRKHLTSADIARKLNLNPSTVHGMLSRRTMQVQKLAVLSEMLQFNFFREIAELLPFNEPIVAKEEPNNNEAELRERIKMLEMEVSILRQTLKDLAGK